jgi:predicted dehydrogenase
MGSPSRFGVVGTGWRSRFYLKLASLMPDKLEVVGVVGRNP